MYRKGVSAIASAHRSGVHAAIDELPRKPDPHRVRRDTRSFHAAIRFRPQGRSLQPASSSERERRPARAPRAMVLHPPRIRWVAQFQLDEISALRTQVPRHTTKMPNELHLIV